MSMPTTIAINTHKLNIIKPHRSNASYPNCPPIIGLRSPKMEKPYKTFPKGKHIGSKVR